MAKLDSLVATSSRVGDTTSRLVKVREIAALLRSLQPAEIDIAVHYLSGALPQGKFGIGYRALQAAADEVAAAGAQLSIVDTDRLIGELAAVRGVGSTARRTQAL